MTTVAAEQKDFEVVLEAVGTVSAISSIDVKPQINSVVTQVHVKEGQFVKRGEVLVTLDSRNDEANLAKAKAQLAKDSALLADAQRQLVRSKDLVSKNFISQGAVDTNQAQVDSQQANLLSDRAAVDAAQVALSYNTVRAAGSGRLGVVNVFPGTAVVANQTVMVTLTQIDPINVAFNLPQRNLGTALAGLKDGGTAVTAVSQETGAQVRGRLQFVDNVIDAATGTVKAKARFDNRDGQLWPGAFVKVRLVSDVVKDAIVIPVAAIVQSAKGPVVYVADKGKANLRPVKTIAIQDLEAVVTGVAPGERVVLEGRQNLRPDTPLAERGPASSPARAVSQAASAS
ncbi:MAG: efflux RND transporter periplasmic adaptor subunit [Rhodoferax sp.]